MEIVFREYADFSSCLGLIISVAGMLLTIWTLKTAQGIKAKLKRRFQLPGLIKEFQDCMTNLSELLVEAAPDSQSLKVLIRRVSVTLKNAHSKTRGVEVGKALKRAQSLLSGQDALTKKDGYMFFLEMTGAHQELCLEKKDDQWEV